MVKQAIAAILLSFLVVFVALSVSDAQADEMKFKIEVGKHYVFMHDCLPQVGCFAEVVHVLAVDKRADRVLVEGGFWVNLGLVAASKEVVPEIESAEPDEPAESEPEAVNPKLRIAWKSISTNFNL
jgi:hypothetical protein